MPQLDTSTFASQLFWLAVTFGLLLLIVNFAVMPQLKRIIAGRESAIAEDLRKAEALRTDADALRQSYEKSLADARTEASAVIASAKADVQADLSARSKALDADLGARINEAEARIGAAKAQALAEVRTVAADAACDIVERLTGAGVSRDDMLRRMDGWGI